MRTNEQPKTIQKKIKLPTTLRLVELLVCRGYVT